MGACIARFLSKDSGSEVLSKSRRSRFQELAGTLVDSNPLDLLKHDASVTPQDGANLEKMARAMISKLSDGQAAKIFLTFSHGARESDAPGYGPGTFYAAAVTKKLWDEGVLCFSPLMLSKGASRHDFRKPLENEKHRCVTMLILKTAALYNDMECLRDIYTAQVNKIKLLPLTLETDNWKTSDAWPQVTKEDLDGMLMVSALSYGFFQLNSIPSPPYTLLDQPGVLDEIVTDLKLQFFRQSKNRQRMTDPSGQSAVLSLLQSPHQCRGTDKLESVGELEDDERTLLDHSDSSRPTTGSADAGAQGQALGKKPKPGDLARTKSDLTDSSDGKRKEKPRRKGKNKTVDSKDKEPDMQASPTAESTRPEHPKSSLGIPGTDNDIEPKSPRRIERKVPKPRSSPSPSSAQSERSKPAPSPQTQARAKEMAAKLRKAAKDRGVKGADDKKTLRA